MMWSYRILRRPEPREEHGHYLALHEVFYDDDGRVHSWTENPISFVCGEDEGPEGIIGSLERALRDARRRPVLWLTAKGEIVSETNIPQPRGHMVSK
jgi:hypothetical protein